MLKRYVQLFEIWQWLGGEEEETNEREYSTTVGELLDWLIGPDWREDWAWLPDTLMVDWEWPDDGESIGYHQRLKMSAEDGIEVSATDDGGEIELSWSLDGVDYLCTSPGWPFSDESDESMTDEEGAIAVKIFGEIESEGLGATLPDVIDWVQRSVRVMGQEPAELTSAGFRNWFGIQRLGSN